MDIYNNSSVLPHGYVLEGARQSFIIDKAIGQGSFGITYLAKYKGQVTGQIGSGSVWMQVCVKEFFMRDMNSRNEKTMALYDTTGNSLVNKYRHAFMREARNLAQMHHPGIVHIFEVIEANNTAYIVMEYIDGGSLDEYIIKRGHLPEKEALVCFESICNAISYMHSQRMLHLDMKPKNVMRAEDGHLFLIDFGLSKQYTENGQPETSTTIGLGTPGYAPLEQSEHSNESTDFRATLDVYALGGTLYKMLTGHTPPTASTVNDAILEGNDIMHNKLKQVGVSIKVAKVISTAMWPGAKKRYQTVRELMNALGLKSEVFKNEQQQRKSSYEKHRVDEDIKSEETSPIYDSKPELQHKPIPRHFPKWFICVLAGTVILASVFGVKSLQHKGTSNGYEWVDLGLSVKWATCNLGATNSEDYGSCFAWSEVSQKDNYDWSSLKYYKGNDTLDVERFSNKNEVHDDIRIKFIIVHKFSKYKLYSYSLGVDKAILDMSDDAANVNWGGKWRMPTEEEFNELIDKCVWTWTTRNGKYGYEVRSKVNENSIFLPAAGYNINDELSGADTFGKYWSSSLKTENEECAHNLSFMSDSFEIETSWRCNGFSIRPVRP